MPIALKLNLASITIFTAALIFLLGFYGLNIGGLDIQSTVNQITGSWPSVSTNNCSFSAAGPAGSCNIVDTVELGGIWFFTIIGSVLFRIGGLFYLLYQIFTILNTFTTFPFFGWIFGAALLILAIESYTLLRSGHHSGMYQA